MQTVLQKPEQKQYPLSMLCAGKGVYIHELPQSRQLQKKLTDLGIKAGMKAQILKNEVGSPLLLALGDTRIAISHAIAFKISVVIL